MHTIVLLHSWRLGLCKVYTALQVLYLQRICHSTCNNATVYQLVHYERLVAGGRCFYIFFNFIEEDYTSQNDAQNRIDFTHFCTVMDQYTNWLWHILHSLIDIFINYTYKLTNGIL